VELSDLERPELHAFMGEVAAVEAAMREHFAAIKMNVSFLGNQHPHLHAIIACRYDADIAPGRPIPVAPGEQFDATLLDRDCRALASRLAEASAI
jgi:diadenosine tetraphosphate (Ap4A) HIT family hydrolase